MEIKALRVVKLQDGGTYPWAIVTPTGEAVEVPRVIVRPGREPFRFTGAFFRLKREALLALDLLRIEGARP